MASQICSVPPIDEPKNDDPSLGKAALAEQEPLLRSIPAQEVASPHSDPVASALAALALVELVRKPVHATRFKLLPAELFDPQTHERLEKSTWTLPSPPHLRTGEGAGGEALLPLSVQERGRGVRLSSPSPTRRGGGGG